MYAMKFKVLSKLLVPYLFLISLSLASCSKDDSATTAKDSIPEIPGYTLVWNDEFGTKNIDLTKIQSATKQPNMILFDYADPIHPLPIKFIRDHFPQTILV